MGVKQLVCLFAMIALLPACNLFGLSNLESQSPFPTTTLELTFASEPPYAEPGYEQIEARTLDGEPIYLDVTLLFKIDPSKMTQIQDQGGTNYLLTVLKPIVQSDVQDVTSRYSAREIVFDKRTEWVEAIRDEMKSHLLEKGFLYADFLIRNVQFTKEFNAKIEQELIVTLTLEAQQPSVTPKQ